MRNKKILCRDCSRRFSFNARQQERFAAHGWKEPIRCPTCRALKKESWQTREECKAMMAGGSMRLYSRAERALFHKLGG